jgi:hypothetical protein
MKRQSFVTTLGIFMTICLLVGLGLGIWFSGGTAFSPGRLSNKQRADISWQGFKSHADFEGQCSLCHAPLEKDQNELCVQCHENIAQQILQRSGTHSLIENVNRCATCHLEHRGEDFDPTSSAFLGFNHENTSFSLKMHQVNYNAASIPCLDCHATNAGFATTTSACANCHTSDNPDFINLHIQEFGPDCTICHDGQDRFSDFNHQSTGFVLEGQHESVSCTECHHLDQAITLQADAGAIKAGLNPGITPPPHPSIPGDPFKDTPTDCAGCHEEPAEHAGFFSPRCEECHTPQGWLPANLEGKQFSHTISTGFSLGHHIHDYNGNLISCKNCHAPDLKTFDMQTCINCHNNGEAQAAFLLGHVDKYSSACLECHDGADRMNHFDHANFFPLDGKHSELVCAQCHVEKKFASTPAECVQCHAEPGIHAGFFGLQCQYCHTAQAWSPAKLQVHNFPLEHGGGGEIACQVCHAQTYAEYTCYGCHDHQVEAIVASHLNAGISQAELPQCVSCHPGSVIERTP